MDSNIRKKMKYFLFQTLFDVKMFFFHLFSFPNQVKIISLFMG